MPRWLRRFTLVMVLLGAGVAGVVVVAWLRLPPLCGNEVTKDVPSPSGRARAVVFVRSRGATADFAIEVSVLPAGAVLPDEPGNVFVADAGAAARVAGKGPWVDVAWRQEGGLEVRYDARARVRFVEATPDAVRVYGVPLAR